MGWVVISYSRGSSRPRNRTCVSCIGRRILYTAPPEKSRTDTGWIPFQITSESSHSPKTPGRTVLCKRLKSPFCLTPLRRLFLPPFWLKQKLFLRVLSLTLCCVSNNKLCTCFTLFVRKIPQRRKWQPAPLFLSGKSGQRRLVGSMGSERVRHDWASTHSGP